MLWLLIQRDLWLLIQRDLWLLIQTDSHKTFKCPHNIHVHINSNYYLEATVYLSFLDSVKSSTTRCFAGTV